MHFATSTRFMLLLATAAALALPAISSAQGGQEVLRDCAQDGDLDGNYSQEDLDEAHDNMPSDIDEYSNCRAVIEAARERSGVGAGSKDASSGSGLGSDGSSGGTGGAPGGAGNDPEEIEKRGDLAQSGDAPKATVAGETAANEGGTFTTDAESDGMSPALIVALILAALAALAGALYLLRDQLPASIASRLPGPLKPDSQA
jgi:cobalamin biosynthesis Mg chelatase CobN